MNKIMTLFIAVALIASLGVGAIAGANEDDFANAVIDEKAQIALEKAAIEFANGNDVEGLAAEETATNNFGKTKLGFHKLGGAVISAGWCPGTPTYGIKMYRPHKGRIVTTPIPPMGCPGCSG
ncbi:MAG: hypothetical protein APG12_00028 [Candidatus Methanofastidiosum methylothiophilum]|uniref:Uncharacterized protein n=1 Tax=Candidatus Methanofastidiosum methylothiophilum TaxID=1705564 RepID=A0A150IJU2_9EURY|nr:MAG: hypothetical protein APG10_01003 [Candidatus Methanofastidiosum methylthiophilus]KYC48718.1 MAG: hypothetical protein APG11_00029 [Candidatus Methanofastidiosum methylthiophilus]KYC51366.1 MAG: hypothetical protein APG12_00028 [Candidatus Methanofastidiosum methylthiophilus]